MKNEVAVTREKERERERGRLLTCASLLKVFVMPKRNCTQPTFVFQNQEKFIHGV